MYNALYRASVFKLTLLFLLILLSALNYSLFLAIYLGFTLGTTVAALYYLNQVKKYKKSEPNLFSYFYKNAPARSFVLLAIVLGTHWPLTFGVLERGVYYRKQQSKNKN